MRPTMVASIMIYALAIVSVVAAIILQVTSVYDAARITFFAATALFLTATVVAVVDTRLNPKISDDDKSRITKGCFRTLGCGAATFVILSILPIIILIGVWLICFIAYGQGIA